MTSGISSCSCGINRHFNASHSKLVSLSFRRTQTDVNNFFERCCRIIKLAAVLCCWIDSQPLQEVPDHASRQKKCYLTTGYQPVRKFPIYCMHNWKISSFATFCGSSSISYVSCSYAQFVTDMHVAGCFSKTKWYTTSMKYTIYRYINPLNTKHRLLYLKTQFVPRSKHFSSQL